MRAGERKLEVLRVLSIMEDGARPMELARELGISTLHAAVLLSRYRKQGILLKKDTQNGCKYCVSDKGTRRLAYLESLKEG